MTEYSTFTTAYRPENLNKEPRVSSDVPEDFGMWKEVVDKTPVIVIYLWSEGCRPCHLIRDKYESLARELSSPYIRFYKDNIDNKTSFHRNMVEVVPTFFILCDGKEREHPGHKARYNGWNEEMKDAIMYYLQQSQRYHQIMQQASKPPRFVCNNNVCYIQNDD